MIKYVLAAMMIATAPAGAQEPNCAATNDVYGVMTEKYGEDRQTIGVTDSMMLVEQWANERTGTWTIIVTDPYNKVTCIVAEGTGFDYVSPPNV